MDRYSVLIFTYFNLKKFMTKYDFVLFNNPNLNSCLTTNSNTPLNFLILKLFIVKNLN